MDIPVVFACPMCATQGPLAFFLSFSIGGVLVAYYLLRPFVRQVSTVWGWPRLDAVRCVALLLLLAWPFLIGRGGLRSHTATQVAVCTVGLVLCTVYLWLRGSWLLEQCSIRTRGRELLFLGVLVPGLLILGTIVGYSILGTVFLGIVWPTMAIAWLLPHAAIGIVMWCFIRAGLGYVLQREATSTSVSATQQEP